MKRRLDNWLDRIFDRANPIAVRDSLGSFALALLAPVYLLIALGLNLFVPRELEYGVIAIACGGFGLICALFIAVFVPLRGLWKARIEDELLSLTPMTPAAQVQGYLTTPFLMATASVFYFASYPLENPEYYNKDIANVPLLMLYSFLFFLALPTYFFSYFARMMKSNELYVAFFCVMFGLVFMLIPSLAVLYHPSTPDFNLTRWAGFLFYWAFIPGIMFSIALAGYLLSLYHFSRPREPFWRSIVVNWFVCLMLGGFYAIIVFVAHLLRILSPFGS